MTTPPSFVSIHGGHSGQFCCHAADTLEEIILLYIEKQFSWVGITEHTPAIDKERLYPEEKAAGWTPALLLDRFDNYMLECRRLQKKYSDKIRVFVAMEIETYSGYKQFIPYLIGRLQPDYIVGSVHFVNDMPFDYSRQAYSKAVKAVGGEDTLYRLYFDQQYEMIKFLKPSVVGHFDLVRIFDDDYRTRLLKPEIWLLIKRNLLLIKDLDLILDLNLRAMLKGGDEPYIAGPILEMACELGIAVVPGDDSHGLGSVGKFMAEGIKILTGTGFDTDWPRPRLLHG